MPKIQQTLIYGPFMRCKFPEHYQKSSKEFKELWQSAYFIFDTNVLLNLYRYSEETRKDWFDVLEKITNRLYLPYQIGHEYHKNRVATITTHKSDSLKILKGITNNIDEMSSMLKKAGGTRTTLVNMKTPYQN